MSQQDYKDRIRDFYDVVSPVFREFWGEHLHDGYYETGDESKSDAQEKLVRYLADAAQLPRDARGLDVGCGMGATSVWLAKNLGARMTGVTLSPVQVEVARQLAAREGVEAEFRMQDADSLGAGEPFDFLWMVGVLGHLDDQRAFVEASPRLLNDGGRYVLGDWVASADLSERDRRKYVDPVLEGMLMPDIASIAEYERWFEASGYRVHVARDIAKSTRKTWDEGVSIIQAPKILKLAAEVGRDALGLLQAIRGMRKAMDRGLIGYGVVIAEKRPVGRP
jgi:tocopherol O-methyltransferase